MERQKTECGIKVGITRYEYDRIDAINTRIWSVVHAKRPFHAKWNREHDQEQTPALLEGSAFHTMVLEPDQFNDRYGVWTGGDRRTKAGKELWKTFQEETQDKDILTNAQFSQVSSMTEALKGQAFSRFLGDGDKEVALVWDDPATGVRCKALIDCANPNVTLSDLKSTNDASLSGFAKSAYNFGYYQQAAFYTSGWKVLTGEDRKCVFCAVEKSAPYAAAAFYCSEDMISAGHNAFSSALDIWAKCVESDDYPSYSEKVQRIDLPAWAQAREARVEEYNVGV